MTMPIEDQVWFVMTHIDIMEAQLAIAVEADKITQAAADKDIANMRAVLRTLEWCERNKPMILELRKEERRAA